MANVCVCVLCTYTQSPERPSLYMAYRPMWFIRTIEGQNHNLLRGEKVPNLKQTHKEEGKKMSGRKRKKGGWEKSKEKRAKSLEAEASKCKTLTELFSRPIEPRKTEEDGHEEEAERGHPRLVQGQTRARGPGKLQKQYRGRLARL